MLTRHLAPALAALLFLTGCGSNNVGKVEGTRWTSVPTTFQHRSLPGGQKGLPTGYLKLDFGRDNSFSFTIDGKSYRGTYTLGMGDSVSLKFDQVVGYWRTHSQSITVSGNYLIMKDPDGTKLTFTKVR
jgi:hypothetical protein